MFKLFLDSRAQKHAFLKRIYVCTVVTLASTCFFSTFWPLMVKGYQTDAKVYLYLNDEESLRSEMQSLLASTIRTRFNDAVLSQLIVETQSRVKIKNRDLLNSDIGSLRRHISVNTAPGTRQNAIQIELAFRGNGTSDEKMFLRLFRDELVEALPQMSAGTDLAGQFRIETKFESQLLRKIENLQNQIANLDRNISDLQQLAKQVDQNPLIASPFRQASTSSSTSNFTNANPNIEIFERLESVEIQPLLNDLETVYSDILSCSDATHYETPRQTALTTFPINGNPHPKQLLILAIMSLAIGVITVVNYNPFADLRFGSLGQMAKILRLPIIATIPVNQLSIEGSTVAVDESRKSKWGNRFAHLASLFLAGFVAFVSTACVINTEIRQQFFENPFYGLTRLIWILSGH